jgi:AmmeMemoRadiSam system protein B
VTIAVREPAVAGHFYPSDPGELAGMVDGFLATVASPAPAAPAYVVPHAGYIYSGRTAAHSYASMRAALPSTAIVIGPSHRVPVRGCVVPAAAVWRTPLGDVEIARVEGLVADDTPFVSEHSLEVQLPFLQRIGVGRVLPIAAGQSTVDEVAGVIGTALSAAGTGSVVVCSTDLSHYQAREAAEEQDARTVRTALALRPEDLDHRDTCGFYALRGLLGWARERGLNPALLHRCTSADTAGPPDRVVGYAAMSFFRDSFRADAIRA